MTKAEFLERVYGEEVIITISTKTISATRTFNVESLSENDQLLFGSDYISIDWDSAAITQVTENSYLIKTADASLLFTALAK